MKLYYHPLSSYCHKVLAACYERAIEFTPEVVSLMDDDARDAYRQIYPLGKIPLLIADDGHRVPESSIIVEYLDTHFDNPPKLIPDDPDRSRQVRFKDRMYDLYLNESVAALLFENAKPEADRDEALLERSRRRIAVMYAFMEQSFESQTWSSGEAFTLSDCAAVGPLYYATRVAPFEAHAKVAAYWRRLEARPSVRRVLEEAAPHAAALMESLSA